MLLRLIVLSLPVVSMVIAVRDLARVLRAAARDRDPAILNCPLIVNARPGHAWHVPRVDQVPQQHPIWHLPAICDHLLDHISALNTQSRISRRNVCLLTLDSTPASSTRTHHRTPVAHIKPFQEYHPTNLPALGRDSATTSHVLDEIPIQTTILLPLLQPY